MNRLDFLNRIKRTILCKKRNWYRRQWNRLQPVDFYKDPERMTSLWYALNEGCLPNLKHPHNFNELLMSLNMRAYRDPQKRELFIRCADKYAVRQYITNKGYADILNECYGVYESFDAIDFDTLPNQFVLKMTTGSGMNFICKDKSTLDIDALRKRVKTWFEDVKTCGLKTAEWHYVEIKPRLIVEKYLHQLGEETSLIDYKFHCFNGQIYGEDVVYDRDIENDTTNDDLYDANWNRTEATLPQYHLTRRLLPKPVAFERMKQIALDLSDGMIMVDSRRLLAFVELKDVRSGGFADALGQLKHTIELFLQNHQYTYFRLRRAYAANIAHPHFHYNMKDEMEDFKNKLHFTLFPETTITIR